jgi:hypothetical protein
VYAADVFTIAANRIERLDIYYREAADANLSEQPLIAHSLAVSTTRSVSMTVEPSTVERHQRLGSSKDTLVSKEGSSAESNPPTASNVCGQRPSGSDDE